VLQSVEQAPAMEPGAQTAPALCALGRVGVQSFQFKLASCLLFLLVQRIVLASMSYYEQPLANH
jgi:hypothetical protein